MQKKIVYIGVSIFAVAVILFFAVGALYGNVLSKAVTTSNLTTSGVSFSYSTVGIGNESLIAVYVMSNHKANVYLFNASAFQMWSGYMNGNHSLSGLAYAQMIGTPNGSVIESNTNTTQIILSKTLGAQMNLSIVGLDRFDGTAYVVIDNTNGNATMKSVVSYVKLTQSTLDSYNKVAITELMIMLAGLAGIIIAVYGAVKKPKSPEAGIGAKSAEGPMSKEYIDSLYKNVGKNKEKKKGG